MSNNRRLTVVLSYLQAKLIEEEFMSGDERDAGPISAVAAFPAMPFPGPETALISTIRCGDVENLVRKLAARPAAS